MTMAADAVAAARAYFEAWNRRDPEATIATFTPGGTYSDPCADDGLTGPASAAYARGQRGSAGSPAVGGRAAGEAAYRDAT